MSIITRKKRLWQESAWLLGICLNGFDDLKAGHIHWISNGKYEGKKWFADPFILDYDEKTIHLLVEEFDYQVHRGRIAKLTVDRNKWEVVECKIVLDLPTHLSFPFIWRKGEVVYVCPENYASGGWAMYRYNDEEERLEFEKLLLEEKLTDAILYTTNDNKHFILSTYIPTPNGKVLSVFQSLGGAKFKKSQKITFYDNTARNAGTIFQYADYKVRPAQESNNIYGHALVFQKMEIIDGKFHFTELCRIYSTHKRYNLGIHTYNQHTKGMAVIDVKGYRYPIVGKLIHKVSQILVLLHLKQKYEFK